MRRAAATSSPSPRASSVAVSPARWASTTCRSSRLRQAVSRASRVARHSVRTPAPSARRVWGISWTRTSARPRSRVPRWWLARRARATCAAMPAPMRSRRTPAARWAARCDAASRAVARACAAAAAALVSSRARIRSTSSASVGSARRDRPSSPAGSSGATVARAATRPATSNTGDANMCSIVRRGGLVSMVSGALWTVAGRLARWASRRSGSGRRGRRRSTADRGPGRRERLATTGPSDLVQRLLEHDPGAVLVAVEGDRLVGRVVAGGRVAGHLYRLAVESDGAAAAWPACSWRRPSAGSPRWGRSGSARWCSDNDGVWSALGTRRRGSAALGA